jgi:Proteasome-substrate-size regulator, mid region/Domain of unknown function (DUF3437)
VCLYVPLLSSPSLLSLSLSLCPLPSALCPLPSALCPLPSALCPLPSALCPLPSPLPSPLTSSPLTSSPLTSSPLSPLPSPLSPLPSPPPLSPLQIDAIRILYRLVTVDRLDITLQSQWAELLNTLVRKRPHEKPLPGLVLDWRPLYEIMVRHYNKKKRSNETGSSKHAASILLCAFSCRRYFPESATVEIMEEFLPNICPHDSVVAWHQAMFVLLIPTRCDTKLIQLWLDPIMSMWNFISDSIEWDIFWLFLTSFVAQHQCGSIDWTPYLPQLYTRFMDLMGPAGGAGVRKNSRSTYNLFTGALFKDPYAFLTNCIANLIVYSINCTPSEGRGHAFEQLDHLMTSISHHYQPNTESNATAAYAAFLRELCVAFTRRHYREQNNFVDTANDARLTDADVRRFISIVEPVLLTSIYSKAGVLVGAANQSIKTLAYVAPHIMIPSIMNRIMPALTAVVEAHQVISSLETLSMLVYVLTNRQLYPDGAQYVEQLLNLTLPGIDINDMLKTRTTLIFYEGVFCSIPIRDPKDRKAAKQLYRRSKRARAKLLRRQGQGAADDADLSMSLNLSQMSDTGAGAGAVSGVAGIDTDAKLPPACISPTFFSQWVPQFVDRLFHVFENLSANDYGNALGQFDDTMYKFFHQLSPELHRSVLTRLEAFVKTRIIPEALVPIGDMCMAACAADPQLGLAVLIPACCQRLREELDFYCQDIERMQRANGGGQSNGKTKKKKLHENLERVFGWFYSIICRCSSEVGPALVPHIPELLDVIERGMQLPSNSVNSTCGATLNNMLTAMSVRYLTEAKSLPPRVWQSKEFQEAHTFVPFWGRSFTYEDLEPSWHEPSEAELRCCNEILQRFLYPAMHSLREHMHAESSIYVSAAAQGQARDSDTVKTALDQHPAVMSKERLWKTLNIIQSLLHGANDIIPEIVLDDTDPGAASSSESTAEAARATARATPPLSGPPSLQRQKSFGDKLSQRLVMPDLGVTESHAHTEIDPIQLTRSMSKSSTTGSSTPGPPTSIRALSSSTPPPSPSLAQVHSTASSSSASPSPSPALGAPVGVRPPLLDRTTSYTDSLLRANKDLSETRIPSVAPSILTSPTPPPGPLGSVMEEDHDTDSKQAPLASVSSTTASTDWGKPAGSHDESAVPQHVAIEQDPTFIARDLCALDRPKITIGKPDPPHPCDVDLAATAPLSRSNLRYRMCTLIHAFAEHQMRYSPDYTEAMGGICSIIDQLLNSRGCKRDVYRNFKNRYARMKNILLDQNRVLYPRYLLVERAAVQQMCRLAEYSTQLPYLPVYRSMILDLLKLSTSNYIIVREAAAQAFYEALHTYPQAREETIPLIIDMLRNEHPVASRNLAITRGAIYLLASRMITEEITYRWELMSHFMLALCETSDKNEEDLQQQLTDLFLNFLNAYHSPPITVADPDEKLSELCVTSLPSLTPTLQAKAKRALQAENCRRMDLYETLVEKLTQLAADSQKLHWRYQFYIFAFLSFMIRDETKMPPRVAELFLHGLVHKLQQLRNLCTDAFGALLLQRKPKRSRISLNADRKTPDTFGPFKLHDLVTIEDTRNSKDVVTQEDFDTVKFQDKNYFGWNGEPSNAFVYGDIVPQTDPFVTTMYLPSTVANEIKQRLENALSGTAESFTLPTAAPGERVQGAPGAAGAGGGAAGGGGITPELMQDFLENGPSLTEMIQMLPPDMCEMFLTQVPPEWAAMIKGESPMDPDAQREMRMGLAPAFISMSGAAGAPSPGSHPTDEEIKAVVEHGPPLEVMLGSIPPALIGQLLQELPEPLRQAMQAGVPPQGDTKLQLRRAFAPIFLATLAAGPTPAQAGSGSPFDMLLDHMDLDKLVADLKQVSAQLSFMTTDIAGAVASALAFGSMVPPELEQLPPQLQQQVAEHVGKALDSAAAAAAAAATEQSDSPPAAAAGADGVSSQSADPTNPDAVSEDVPMPIVAIEQKLERQLSTGDTDPTDELVDIEVDPVLATLSDVKWWQSFVTTMARGVPLEQVAFSRSRAQVFKGIFQCYWMKLWSFVKNVLDTLLDVKPHDPDFIGCTCVASEIIAGIMRGSKHWDFATTEAMWNEVIPVYLRAISQSTPETRTFWDEASSFIVYDRDVRRFHLLKEAVFNSLFDPNESVQVHVKRIDSLLPIIAEFSWRGGEFSQRVLHRLIDEQRYMHGNPIVRQVCTTLFAFVTHFETMPKRHPDTNLPVFCEYGAVGSVDGDHTSNVLAPQAVQVSSSTQFPFEASDLMDLVVQHLVTQLEEAVTFEQGRLARALIRERTADKSNAVLSAKHKAEEEKDSAERKRVVVLRKVVLQWCMLVYSRGGLTQGNYAASLIAPVLELLSDADQDVYRMASSAGDYLAGFVHRSCLPDVILALDKVSRSPTWHVRVAVLPFSYYISTLRSFLLKEKERDQVIDICIRLLSDSHHEVRVQACTAISSIARTVDADVRDKLLVRFFHMADTKVDVKRNENRPRSSPAVHSGSEAPAATPMSTKHGGILGISAVISAFPFNVPEWMPDVLMRFGSYISAPSPCHDSVKETLAKFWKNHQDTWEVDKEMFTEDQRFELTQLVVSPCYYA